MTTSGHLGRNRHVARIALLAALLFGCKPPGFAGDPLTEERTDLSYPRIEPLAPILARMEPEIPDAADPDPVLRARGEELRARTGTGAVPAAPAREAGLAERGAALRQRAEEVRQQTP